MKFKAMIYLFEEGILSEMMFCRNLVMGYKDYIYESHTDFKRNTILINLVRVFSRFESQDRRLKSSLTEIKSFGKNSD